MATYFFDADFMLDEMAKSTVKAGGMGLSNTVMAEMLKMQEGRQ